MTYAKPSAARRFSVIDGGARGRPVRAALPQPPVPEFGPSELAAEMAELYALGLLRDVPFDRLDNPHHLVRVDDITSFTLHEMLCELRSLPFLDRRATPDAGGAPVSSLTGPGGDSGHRRALRWNGDGQLTLRTAFRGGVAGILGAPRMSSLWAMDNDRRKPCPMVERPAADASMSRWLKWVEHETGAGLCLPGRVDARHCLPKTLGDLAQHVHSAHPARVFFNAALALLAEGAAFDLDLGAENGLARGRWTPSRLLALMADAADRATRMALSRAGKAARLSRPGVIAARMTVLLGREDLLASGTPPVLAAAAQELSCHAPNLLSWVARSQSGRSAPRLFRDTAFLPVDLTRAPLNPWDAAAHGVVAGALATLVKAVFDTMRPTHLRMVAANGPSTDITQEIDRLAAQIALGRSASAAYFGAESHQDLRLGEAIAMQVMRESFEADNEQAGLAFTDFDGKAVQLLASVRTFDRAHVHLRRDGASVTWPADGETQAPHLTAVH
ncbi:bromoperoxidase [Thalassococcus sp. CAU 1522]|uniref:Bromoperoxidase n=1 Tax=Thalassococcus arenae TaxID=2851652 RepID=A0ABS6N7P0_9RHOB|nr:bromoperoxidase [Thalassococcus arenae]MBV2360021.1 bromoperoxidase [Thalassococcus arenae]